MYKCEECSGVFKRPEVQQDAGYPGTDYGYTPSIELCPVCKSEKIKQIEKEARKGSRK